MLLLIGLHGEAQRAGGAGDDGDLADGHHVLLLGRHQRVADFVIGDDALFVGGDDHALLLAAGDDVLGGAVQIGLSDGAAVVAHRAQGCLVEDVGQLRAGSAGGRVGHTLEIDVFVQRLFPGVHLEDLQTALHVGQLHGDAPVEAAGTQQRLVQNLRAIGGAQHHDALFGVEAVHLGQQLVQRLLALVVAADADGVALLADGVDFVDEHDARGLGRRLLEQIAHARRAGAHEHLHKGRAADEEEGAARLARHGLGQKRLAGSGRAH